MQTVIGSLAILGCLVFGNALTLRGADSLDFYVIDTEGGKAIIVVTPEGETMLVDAGYPRDDDRDTNRIVAAAESLGIREFDYILATHYDADHSGNIAAVDASVPGKVFIDHGEIVPDVRSDRYYQSYVAAIGDRERIIVKPGDVLPIKGVRVQVLTAAGEVIDEPLPGGGQTNPLCAGLSEPETRDTDDNAYSVGLLYEFGDFRMVDLADALQYIEYRLMCPTNPIGTVDLFMVSHHGLARSNGAFLIHALQPIAAIMNNGPRKGGEAEVFDVLASSPGFEDLWQLHASERSPESNRPDHFIANLTSDCEGKMIHVSAMRDGSFTITNSRNDYSKTYAPR